MFFLLEASWDLLFLNLIAAPLLLGYFFSIHGLSLVTHISKLIYCFAAYSAFVFFIFYRNYKKTSQKNWGKSRVFGLLKWVMNKLKRKELWLIWLGAGLVGSNWATSALHKHQSLRTSFEDTGIFTNALWNLIHGYGYISAPKDGLHLWADHQAFILPLVAPLFWLFPSAKTLLVLQSFGLAIGAVPLFIIACQHLKGTERPLAALLPLAYWLYLPLRNVNAFEFHPEVWMLPFFLSTIAALQSPNKRSWLWGSFFLVLALLSKESAGPVAAGLGLAWWLGAAPQESRARMRIWGGRIFILGTVFFLLDLQVPSLLGESYPYFEIYLRPKVGQNSKILSVLQDQNHAQDVIRFLYHLVNTARIRYFLALLRPLAFLPLLAWRVMPAFFSSLLMLFLISDDSKVNINYHYSIEPSVALFWALIISLSQLAKLNWIGPKRLLVIFTLWSLASSKYPETYRRLSFMAPDHPQAVWLLKELIPRIDPIASIAASDGFGAYVTTRHWANRSSHNLKDETGALVECVLQFPPMDIAIGLPVRKESELLELAYKLEYRCGRFSSWISPGRKKPCLSSFPSCSQDESKAWIEFNMAFLNQF